jgi:hydroxypyruvate isomerase
VCGHVIWSLHVSMLFRELPYLRRQRAARDAGFDMVETWWPPRGVGRAWADAIGAQDLRVASINAHAGDLEAGDRGFLNDAARRDEAVGVFTDAVALARRVDCTHINVLAGRELPGSSREEQLHNVREALARCAEVAEREQVTILVEPVNALDSPGYLLPTPAAAAAMIEQIDSPHVRLLYDAYHAARAGLDPIAEVGEHAGLIGHVQYADCPGRGAPGTGDVDLGAFAAALGAAGYDGPVGLEFDPGGPTRPALAMLPALPALPV